ncbi:GD11743 [Drosophila simulans]|nr:GD11743 [Drosophila simulans]
MEKQLSAYIEEAMQFYAIGKGADFKAILEKGIATCMAPYSTYEQELYTAYSLLATYLTNHAFRVVKSRPAFQAMAINCFDQLESLRQQEDPHLQVTKGFLWMLSSSRAQDADALFISVLRKQPKNILALIGRACLAYNRQDYIGALGYFKSVLLIQSKGMADVWVGIGHCFWKMGEREKARVSFKIALEHGQCLNATLGLALINFDQNDEQSYQEGKMLLAEAYTEDNRNPELLSILAGMYYTDGNHKMVWSLAGNAINFTANKHIESRNYFQIAKSYHATDQFESAKKYYLLAAKAAPEGYILPLVGMAQMYLNDGELSKAKGCLESFLMFEPDEPVVMDLLAKIYIEEKCTENIDEAIEMLVNVVESASYRQNINSWLNLAFAYEQKRLWAQVVNAYQKAMDIYLSRGHQIPIEWLNNLANSQLMAKMPERALDTLDEALSKCRVLNSEHKTTNLLSLQYNRGLVLEELHMFTQAVDNYMAITKEYPSYHDCYLRLAVMAIQMNKHTQAIEHLKDILVEDNLNMTARTYMGDCFKRLSLDKFATFNYNMILVRPSNFTDTYASMAMGNFCLEKLQNWLAEGNFRAARKQKEKALQCFAKVLDCNPKNLWAANGIGAVLSSCYKLSAGGAIFQQIIEGGNKCIPAIINSAHIALVSGQYRLAIQTYERCLKNHLPKNSVDVMHYLAKALYNNGDTRMAKMWLLKVRHLVPQDPHVIFNLGLVIKKEAEDALALPRPQLDDLMGLDGMLKMAFNLFQHVNQNHPKISVRLSAMYAEDCQNLITELVAKTIQARESQASDEDRIKVQRERIRDHEEHKHQQELQREEEERVRRENQKIQRKEVLERTRKIISAPLASEMPKKSAGKGRANKKQGNGGGRAKNKSNSGSSKKKTGKRNADKEKKDIESLKKPKSKEFIDTDDDNSE